MEIREKLLLTGPNRRSDNTLLEQQLVLGPRELEALAPRIDALRRRLLATLQSQGIAPPAGEDVASHEGVEVGAVFASLFTATALALQTAAGHRVAEQGFVRDSAGNGVWAWFEYEDDEVGRRASALALRLLSELEPALDWQRETADDLSGFSRRYEEFLEFARARVLPRDVDALVRACHRLDVPVVKLERAPYQGVQGAFRIRPNGLLKLGHCAYQQLLDGNFCVSRNAALLPLLHDREARLARLAQLHTLAPRHDSDGGDCHRLLVADHQVLGVICNGLELPLAQVHESALLLARSISSRLDVGMLVLDIVTRDIGGPLAESGAAVTGLELAPRLDELLPAHSPLLERAAEAFVRWLYPPGHPARIPIVAVTGTNGKTTTSRMITRIMKFAGRRVGTVCSGGFYIGEQLEGTPRQFGGDLQHHLFERPEVDFAVLEEYFGRIARAGFPFRWCDVAVLTNVTADHLGRIGTHTLAEMAALKGAVATRARERVVLNADDAHCLAMAASLAPERVCVVSQLMSHAELQARLPAARGTCVLETIEDAEWIVLHDRGVRTPVIAVNDIPASFRGDARHNVSNAMQAAAACHASGAEAPALRAGLASFVMDFDSNPGRLNIYDGLPFRVIMDYAHNADGYRTLSAFVDRQRVTGRRIVMMSAVGDRLDHDVMTAAAEMAGHFDHYVCRNYLGIRGERPPQAMPELLKTGLCRAGVPEDAITTIADPTEAIHFCLNMAAKGDLLVLLPGDNEFASTWELLGTFAAQLAHRETGA